ncbi:Tat pathway signal sequence domain protein, partial [Brevibacillus sp. SIMBA_076]
RYTIPASGFDAAYGQFRNADGTPLYPQRATNVARIISSSITGGATFSGAIDVKVIAVNSTVDADAYPWEGAWYADQIRSALGSRADAQFRV